MFNKVYNKTKEIIKENRKFFICLAVTYLLFAIPLPYYINSPGGLINLDTRIEIEEQYDSSGSFNLTYVSEIRANIPFLLYSYLNKDWKVIPISDVVMDNETLKDSTFRDHIMIEEAIDNAVIYGFNKANESIDIESRTVYVTYVYKEAITDLKVGDQIIDVDGVTVDSLKELQSLITDRNVDEKIVIKVINNNKTYYRNAKIIDNNGIHIIGITLSETKEYAVNKSIKLNFPKSESGPSGGLMMALQIYDLLTKEDLTHGLKIVGTGTIDENGNVGAIGGIEFKIKGAVKKKAKIFLVPSGDNYKEALKIVEENNYDLQLVPITTFNDALDFLNNL